MTWDSLKSWQKELVVIAIIFFGYLIWLGNTNGSRSESDSAILNVFPQGAQYKNYELTASLSIEKKAAIFKMPYKVYRIERASFGDTGGDYLEFNNCYLDSRNKSGVCQAYDCNNEKNVQAFMENKTPDVSSLLNECGKTLKAWRVELKSE